MKNTVMRSALMVAGMAMSLGAAPAVAAVDQALSILPPKVDYATVCKLQTKLTHDTHDWSKWDGKSSPLDGSTLTNIGRLYLKGSAEQPANPILAHKILKVAAAKPGKHRGAALLLLADTYAKGSGTAQDGVLAKETLEEALKISGKGAGFALGSIYEKEGEFTKAAAAYAKDASLKTPPAALALARLYKSEKVPSPHEGSAAEMVSLAQNMLLELLATGDCDALTVLGGIYLRGETVPRDEETAAKWLQAATNGENMTAMLVLADLYQRGVGVPHDRQKVQEMWERAASLGSSEAMYNIGFSYVFGDYVKQDIPKGIAWLEKASDRYYLQAMYLLFKVYRGDYGGGTNYAKAMEWLHRAAAHPAAETSIIYELAQAYQDGKIVTRDFAKALQYYQLAAKLGDQDAPFRVGELYQRALGTKPEPRLALRFYRLGASRGSKEAMMAMYYNYFCGISVSYDAVKAQRWLDRAISNGSSEAIMLAQAEYQLRKTPEDMEKAVKLLKEAIELGDRKAMVEMARLYLTGTGGVSEDEDAANALLQDAIAPGDNRSIGLIAVASLYLKGTAVEFDSKRAVTLLEEAATYHDSEAVRMLGNIYMKGLRDIPADVNRGLTYLQQAADLGNDQAMVALAGYYRKTARDDQGRDAALDWYREAGLRGNHDASAFLTEMYRQGGWIKEDPARATEWLARLQSPESCPISKSVTIARIYSQGNGAAKDADKASEWFERAVRMTAHEVSDIKALAEAYAFGYGTRQDYSKALEWETKLADMGMTRSMRKVARMNIEGLGKAQDLDLGREWYERAAETGDPQAYLELATIYERGIGVGHDADKATEYLEEAAKLHSNRALRILAQRAMDAKDYADAARWYEQAATEGDVKAMFQLIALYGDASMPIKNDAKVRQWLQQAVNVGKNNPDDMARIGEAYLAGVGVESNGKEAAQWFYRAAKAGSSRGMRMLGRMYMDGNAVAQDRKVALLWLGKAAQKGDLSSIIAVADAYATGTGTAVDHEKARRFYHAAAQKGSMRAMREIGHIYMRGRGVERDEKKGIEWLTLAAERGDVRSMEELARSYASGFGVIESSEQALGWWKRAADAGSAEAKRQLEIAAETGYSSPTSLPTKE